MSSTTVAPAGSFDRFFRLTERGSSVKQEVVAGATTFAAMAYIIAVNPSIMSQTGMDRGDLVIGTAIAAIFGTVMMALTANLPLAVAPAMGSNVILTFVVVKTMGVPWQGALAMVCFTGFVFLALSLSKVRERVAQDVPEVLRLGIQAGVGTLICFIRAARRRLHRRQSYILLNLAVGRAKQISGIVWGLGVVFVAFFVVTTTLM
jgi:AGZA family xanthine/uracil permease-like MFS transporter